jgi:hypothetical protein
MINNVFTPFHTLRLSTRGWYFVYIPVFDTIFVPDFPVRNVPRFLLNCPLYLILDEIACEFPCPEPLADFACCSDELFAIPI